MYKIITALALTTVSALAAEKNLFPEGDFESRITFSDQPGTILNNFTIAEQGTLYVEPGDYKSLGNLDVRVKSEGGEKFLQFDVSKKAGAGNTLRTYIVLELPKPAARSITVALRWRLKDFEPLAEGETWASAQIEPTFVMKDGTTQTLSGSIRLQEDTNGQWQEVEKTFDVPRGATHLVLMPGLYISSGTLDVDDLKVLAD